MVILIQALYIVICYLCVSDNFKQVFVYDTINGLVGLFFMMSFGVMECGFITWFCEIVDYGMLCHGKDRARQVTHVPKLEKG